ncbi:MAG: NUDIX domain-containing protein [Bacteroidota bacterium]
MADKATPASGLYTNHIRIRACGLLVEHGRILLVQLFSPVVKRPIWTPPGGGVKFGETVQQAVQREFLEETNLEVGVEELALVNELIEPPYHVIEFYFRVKRRSGKIQLGTDPEHDPDHQILTRLQFFDSDKLDDIDLKPDAIHEVLAEDTDFSGDVRYNWQS